MYIRVCVCVCACVYACAFVYAYCKIYTPTYTPACDSDTCARITISVIREIKQIIIIIIAVDYIATARPPIVDDL